MGSLATLAETMHKAADTMAQAVRDVHDQAGSTAAGAEHSSHQLTAVAAAIEEMTSSVAEISCHFPLFMWLSGRPIAVTRRLRLTSPPPRHSVRWPRSPGA